MERFWAFIFIVIITILFILFAPRILTMIAQNKAPGDFFFQKSTTTPTSSEASGTMPSTSTATRQTQEKPAPPPPPAQIQQPQGYQQLRNIRIIPVGYDLSKQYFYIYNYSNMPVNITGFRVKSMQREVTIPQGVERVPPSLFAVPHDIVLQPSDHIIVSTKASPLGFNFKENLCIGYLKNNFPSDFYPSISFYCPQPDRSEYLNLDPACISFIESIPLCSSPENLPRQVSTDAECVNYLNQTFNYGSCFQKYSNNKDFLKGPWHAFLNLSEPIFRQRYERVILYDKLGNELDRYTY